MLVSREAQAGPCYTSVGHASVVEGEVDNGITYPTLFFVGSNGCSTNMTLLSKSQRMTWTGDIPIAGGWKDLDGGGGGIDYTTMCRVHHHVAVTTYVNLD